VVAIDGDVGSGVHTLRWELKYNTFGSATRYVAGHVDLVRIVVNDADGDALPDGWETAHSLDPHERAPMRPSTATATGCES